MITSCSGNIMKTEKPGIQEIIRIITEFFSTDDHARVVLVYGSTAKGEMRAHSDVDIAVAGNGPLPLDMLAMYQQGLEARLDRGVDLIDLNRVEGLILHRAVTGGIKIKTDQAMFARLHIKALGFYEDYLPLLRRMRKGKIERFING